MTGSATRVGPNHAIGWTAPESNQGPLDDPSGSAEAPMEKPQRDVGANKSNIGAEMETLARYPPLNIHKKVPKST